MNDKAKEFIACLKPIAEVYCYDPYIIFTHAWHESGGFDHVIGNFNYWGLKKPLKWQGLVKTVMTHEYIKGVKVAVNDYFIDFPTCEAAIIYYDNLISRLYPSSYFNRQAYEPYFEGLVNGKYKYATDPNYPIKLKQLYVKLKNQKLLG